MKGKRMKQFWYAAGAVLLLMLNANLRAGEIPVVKSGKAVSEIILAPDAGEPEKHAAAEFRLFLKKITGAEPAVRTVPGKGMLPIRIGVAGANHLKESKQLKEAVAKLKDDGFVIDASPDGVQIVANQKRGLIYGVYHLLKEYGGMLWLYPGEEGEYCPKSPDFRVPEQCRTFNPDFPYRRFSLNGGSGWTPDTYDWLLRNGLLIMGTTGGSREQQEFMAKREPVYERGGHEMTNLLVGYKKNPKEFNEAYDKLFREHPEYFGLKNGKRIDSGNAPRTPGGKTCQPCTGNPDVLKRMLENALEQIRQFGTLENARVFCNDDHTSWCECEKCRKLDSPNNDPSNVHATRWWHFVNYMADGILRNSGSNVSVATLVYQTYRFPPADIKPDPRVRVRIAPHGRCYLHPLTDPNCPPNAQKFREMFDSWARIGMRCYTFEYHPEMPGASNYLFHEKSWVKDLQYYHKLNMVGFGMIVTAPTDNYKRHAYGRKNFYRLANAWYSHWQRHWFTGYYAWNIDADFDRIYEKINSACYGNAWPVMREYRKELIHALYDSNVHMCYGTPNNVLGKCYDRPGLSDRVLKLLDQAEKAAANDPLRLKRIRRDREYFNTNWVAAYQEYKAAKQKEYNASRRKGTVKIDGKLEDADWKNCDFVTDFMLFHPKEGFSSKPATPQTFVRMLYDDGNLYFAVEAMKPKNGRINLAAKNNGLDTLNGSHLEIFITPPGMSGKYYHLGFSPDGKLFQAMTTSGSSRDETFKLNPEFKTAELPDRWILETRIPIGKLKRKIVDGEVWKINVARSAVGEDGGMQGSSWSSGVFHGSDVHRSVAFGKTGAILRNGDMEDGAPFPKRNPKAKSHWNFLSEQVPKFWFFNENNTGTADWRTDSPASGKYYLRIEGRNVFVGQALNFTNASSNSYRITAKVRGKGKLLLSLYSQGKYYTQKTGYREEIDSPDRWITVSAQVTVPPEFFKHHHKPLYLRVSGMIDVDDVRVTPVEDETLPDASRHS